MKRLKDQRSPQDDIEDAEFEEVSDETYTLRSSASRPPPPPPPPPPPTFGAWWRHQGFFIKTFLVFVPLLFLAMCVAAVGDAPDTAVETSNVEQEADQLENAADQTRGMTEAIEPDVEAAGLPTCGSIEGEVSALLTKTISKAVLEINNTRTETVDDFPQCYGTALTEAGTIFITYGIQLSQKGQAYFYVRPTSDTIIPPGEENARMPSFTAPTSDERQDDASQSRKPAEPPSTTSSPTAPPTPAASSPPTEDDIYAPRP